MAKLGECASIFQLAFGVNAIVPALYISLHTTRETLENVFANALKHPDFRMKIELNEALEFASFIVAGARGSRVAGRQLIIPGILMGVSVLFSFFGLMGAAICPDVRIPNGILWIFSIYSLFICPGVGFFYETRLRWLRRAMVRHLVDPSNWSEGDLKLYQQMRDIGKSIDKVTESAYDALYEMSKQDLKIEWNDLLRRRREDFKKIVRVLYNKK